MTKGETSPPSLLTEADLIALMEKHGIGENHASSSFSVAFRLGYASEYESWVFHLGVLFQTHCCPYLKSKTRPTGGNLTVRYSG